jgi:hypothetical protein
MLWAEVDARHPASNSAISSRVGRWKSVEALSNSALLTRKAP